MTKLFALFAALASAGIGCQPPPATTTTTTTTTAPSTTTTEAYIPTETDSTGTNTVIWQGGTSHAPYRWTLTDTATFDSVVDPVNYFGYNDNGAGTRINPAYPSLGMAIEGNYRAPDGRTYTEWHIEGQSTSGRNYRIFSSMTDTETGVTNASINAEAIHFTDGTGASPWLQHQGGTITTAANMNLAGPTPDYTGITVGPGTGMGYLNLNGGGQSTLGYSDAGTPKFWQYMTGGNLYLRNMVNARMTIEYVNGPTAITSPVKYSSVIQFADPTLWDMTTPGLPPGATKWLIVLDDAGNEMRVPVWG